MPETPPYGPLIQFMEQAIPFNRLLGVRCDAVEEGRCLLRIPWSDDLIGDPLRPAVHGGVMSTLADVAGGMACFSKLMRAEDRVSTVDLRVDYLRPGDVGVDLTCQATVLRMGNRVAVTAMEVFSGDPGAGPVALGRGVYNVLRGGS